MCCMPGIWVLEKLKLEDQYKPKARLSYILTQKQVVGIQAVKPAWDPSPEGTMKEDQESGTSEILPQNSDFFSETKSCCVNHAGLELKEVYLFLLSQ